MKVKDHFSGPRRWQKSKSPSVSWQMMQPRRIKLRWQFLKYWEGESLRLMLRL